MGFPLSDAFPEGLKIKVTKYTFVLTSAKREPIIFVENGQEITQRIKDELKFAKSGDLITISHVEGISPMKSSGLIKALTITIE
ncbi:MAG: hypothetical protein SGJ10_04995 [Bacteroidota bacterium]|nr:hypothetical protein [Bacteroidota bacterium]